MYGGMILPNIEAKIAKTGVHRYAIANHVKVNSKRRAHP